MEWLFNEIRTFLVRCADASANAGAMRSTPPSGGAARGCCRAALACACLLFWGALCERQFCPFRHARLSRTGFRTFERSFERSLWPGQQAEHDVLHGGWRRVAGDLRGPSQGKNLRPNPLTKWAGRTLLKSRSSIQSRFRGVLSHFAKVFVSGNKHMISA